MQLDNHANNIVFRPSTAPTPAVCVMYHEGCNELHIVEWEENSRKKKFVVTLPEQGRIATILYEAGCLTIECQGDINLVIQPTLCVKQLIINVRGYLQFKQGCQVSESVEIKALSLFCSLITAVTAAIDVRVMMFGSVKAKELSLCQQVVYQTKLECKKITVSGRRGPPKRVLQFLFSKIIVNNLVQFGGLELVDSALEFQADSSNQNSWYSVVSLNVKRSVIWGGHGVLYIAKKSTVCLDQSKLHLNSLICGADVDMTLRDTTFVSKEVSFDKVNAKFIRSTLRISNQIQLCGQLNVGGLTHAYNNELVSANKIRKDYVAISSCIEYINDEIADTQLKEIAKLDTFKTRLFDAITAQTNTQHQVSLQKIEEALRQFPHNSNLKLSMSLLYLLCENFQAALIALADAYAEKDQCCAPVFFVAMEFVCSRLKVQSNKELLFIPIRGDQTLLHIAVHQRLVRVVRQLVSHALHHRNAQFITKRNAQDKSALMLLIDNGLVTEKEFSYLLSQLVGRKQLVAMLEVSQRVSAYLDTRQYEVTGIRVPYLTDIMDDECFKQLSADISKQLKNAESCSEEKLAAATELQLAKFIHDLAQQQEARETEPLVNIQEVIQLLKSFIGNAVVLRVEAYNEFFYELMTILTDLIDLEAVHVNSEEVILLDSESFPRLRYQYFFKVITSLVTSFEKQNCCEILQTILMLHWLVALQVGKPNGIERIKIDPELFQGLYLPSHQQGLSFATLLTLFQIVEDHAAQQAMFIFYHSESTFNEKAVIIKRFHAQGDTAGAREQLRCLIQEIIGIGGFFSNYHGQRKLTQLISSCVSRCQISSLDSLQGCGIFQTVVPILKDLCVDLPDELAERALTVIEMLLSELAARKPAESIALVYTRFLSKYFLNYADAYNKTVFRYTGLLVNVLLMGHKACAADSAQLTAPAKIRKVMFVAQENLLDHLRDNPSKSAVSLIGFTVCCDTLISFVEGLKPKQLNFENVFAELQACLKSAKEQLSYLKKCIVEGGEQLDRGVSFIDYTITFLGAGEFLRKLYQLLTCKVMKTLINNLRDVLPEKYAAIVIPHVSSLLTLTPVAGSVVGTQLILARMETLEKVICKRIDAMNDNLEYQITRLKMSLEKTLIQGFELLKNDLEQVNRRLDDISQTLVRIEHLLDRQDQHLAHQPIFGKITDCCDEVSTQLRTSGQLTDNHATRLKDFIRLLECDPGVDLNVYYHGCADWLRELKSMVDIEPFRAYHTPLFAYWYRALSVLLRFLTAAIVKVDDPASFLKIFTCLQKIFLEAIQVYRLLQHLLSKDVLIKCADRLDKEKPTEQDVKAFLIYCRLINFPLEFGQNARYWLDTKPEARAFRGKVAELLRSNLDEYIFVGTLHQTLIATHQLVYLYGLVLIRHAEILLHKQPVVCAQDIAGIKQVLLSNFYNVFMANSPSLKMTEQQFLTHYEGNRLTDQVLSRGGHVGNTKPAFFTGQFVIGRLSRP